MGYSLSRAVRRANTQPKASGLPRSSTRWNRQVSAGDETPTDAEPIPAPEPPTPAASTPPSTHSGCARATSESALTISGSTQRPKSMPAACTCSISGCNPPGQVTGSTNQSPRARRSSERPVNQPSSSTKRSTPTTAAASARRARVGRSWSKYTASQVFSTTGRCPVMVDQERTHGCSRAESPSSPAAEYTATVHGVVWLAPGATLSSPGASSSPLPSAE